MNIKKIAFYLLLLFTTQQVLPMEYFLKKFISPNKYTIGIILLLGCVILKIKYFTTNTIVPTIEASGIMETSTIDLNGNIRTIFISHVGILTITQCNQNDKETLTIQCDKNFLPYLDTQVNETTLQLGIKNDVNSNANNKSILYYLKLKNINQIKTSGTVLVYSTDKLSGDLTLNSSGSSKINLEDIINDKLKANNSGSSLIRITGKTNMQDITSSGSARYDAYKLQSNTATVAASGSTKLFLNVKKNITGFTAGSAQIEYDKQYDPMVNVQKSGSSKIKGI